MLGVGDSITDDVLEEDIEDSAGLFVDEARDTPHTATACETADGRLPTAVAIALHRLADLPHIRKIH